MNKADKFVDGLKQANAKQAVTIGELMEERDGLHMRCGAFEAKINGQTKKIEMMVQVIKDLGAQAAASEKVAARMFSTILERLLARESRASVKDAGGK